MKLLLNTARCLALGALFMGVGFNATAQSINPGSNSATCQVSENATGLQYTFAPSTTASPTQTFSYWGTKGDLEITSLATANPVTVKSTGYGRGQIIAYYSVGSCNPVPYPYEVNKVFTTSEPIIGPLCVQAGVAYTWSINPIISKTDQINAQIGIDKYTWQITDLNGNTGTPGLPALPPQVSGSNAYSGDFSAIRIAMPSTFSSFKLRVKVGDCNSFGPTITVNPTPLTPTINGPSCRSTSDTSPFTLSVPNSQVGVNYVWNVPPSWTITPTTATVGVAGTGGTISVSVTPDANGGDVTVTAVNNSGVQCATPPVAKYTLKRQLSSTATFTGIPTCFTVNSSYTVSVSPVANNSLFYWSIPTGYSGNGQAGPVVVTTSIPSITLVATTSAIGRLGVSSNLCGDPTVTPNQTGVISATLTASGDNGCTYSYTPIGCGSLQLTSGVSSCLPVYSGNSNPGVTYTFSSPNNPSVTQRSRTYTPDNGLTNEIVTVQIKNTSTGSCFEANFTIGPVTLAPCARQAGGGNGTTKGQDAVQVYPNPTAGRLNIDLPVRAGETSKLVLTDVAGRQQAFTITKEARTSLDVSKLPEGMYTLRAELANGKVLTQKVMINHAAPSPAER